MELRRSCFAASDGITQVTEVRTLYGATGGDPEARVVLKNGCDPRGSNVECTWNSADRVVNFRGTIQRDDHVVHKLHNGRGIPSEQQSRAEQCDPDLSITKQIDEAPKVGVHQGLAA